MNCIINAMNKQKISLAVAIWALHNTAYALGGIDKANTAAGDIKAGFYTLVGTCAGIYLLWLVVQAFTEKKSWSDFGWGVVWVAVAGAALTLADYGWALFK